LATINYLKGFKQNEIMKERLSFFAFGLLFISTGHAQEFEYSFREVYEMSLPAQLTVSSSDGNIKVVTSEGNEIEVFYIVTRDNKVLKIDRKDLEKELTLEVVHEKTRLHISVKHQNENWSFFSSDHIEVNFEIHAPRQTVSNLNTSDGNISLLGLTGDQQCKTSDGNISIKNVRGNITGRTSDGNIRVSEVRGSVGISTSDGNIEISDIVGDVRSSTSDGNIVISDVQGNTSSKTSDGHITFKELSGSFTGITSDGNIRGNFVQLKQELTVRTGDGNINITIPDRLGLDLDISGESLHIPFDNFSGRSDDKVIRGTANGGGIPVKLSASDGNVTLAYQ
jgi:hypothetical protein